jgi:hypothetical protein
MRIAGRERDGDAVPRVRAVPRRPASPARHRRPSRSRPPSRAQSPRGRCRSRRRGSAVPRSARGNARICRACVSAISLPIGPLKRMPSKRSAIAGSA